MSHKFAIFVALALVAVASAGLVRRDTGQEAHTATEVFENIQKTLTDIQDAALKSFGLDNKEQVQDKLVETGRKVAGAVDTYIVKLQKETESLKDNDIVKDIRKQAETLAESIKSQHPETTAELENVNKKFEALAAKTKEFANTQQVKDIRDLSENLLSEFRTAITTVFEDVAKTVKAEH